MLYLRCILLTSALLLHDINFSNIDVKQTGQKTEPPSRNYGGHMMFLFCSTPSCHCFFSSVVLTCSVLVYLFIILCTSTSVLHRFMCITAVFLDWDFWDHFLRSQIILVRYCCPCSPSATDYNHTFWLEVVLKNVLHHRV